MEGGALQPWLDWLASFGKDDIVHLIDQAFWWGVLLAVFGSLSRLGTIKQIIRDYGELRGPLWDLRKTVDRLKEMEPGLRSLADQVSLLDAKIDAARQQVAELQIESISSRTEPGDNASDEEEYEPEALSRAPVEGDGEEDRNWEMLRGYWRRNTQRIEYIIENIKDGRTKLAYDRLPRTNYTRILHKLQGQKLVSPAGVEAAKKLNDLFNQYRPRNRKVPDEVVGSLGVLDHQLDKELVPYAVMQAEEARDDLAQPKPLDGNGASRVTEMPRTSASGRNGANAASLGTR